jgi:hypothetical protein
MPIEYEVLPFYEWLFPSPRGFGALAQFCASFSIMAAVALLFWYVLNSFRLGPGEAFYTVARVVYKAFSDDLPNFSLTRTLAITRLTVKEAVRRRALVAFIVFVIVLLFAGLFLDVKSTNPAKLYLSFVLWTSNLLVLALALLTSTFSLPNDIKNRTIYTVVTKPVRPGEIVLGRILGFATIGTAVLAVMCLASFIFVQRGVDHVHTIDAQEMVAAGSGDSLAATGRTSFDAYHRHEVTINADGTGQTDIQNNHSHPVKAIKDGDKVRYEIGTHEGLLMARVPLYGKLMFIDRQGNLTDRGISVGDEWTYRSYIEGKTQAAAVWQFSGVTEEDFPNGLPIEMNILVFRTFKGNIDETVLGDLILENPNPKAKIKRSEVITFPSREFTRFERLIPRKLKGVDGSGQVVDIDIFKDLVYEGQLQIKVKCAQPSQYFGMAQPDLFLHAADRPFAVNFIKGHVSVWLQMLMVDSLGVMFSTFLSGPVSMLATLAAVILGYFQGFVVDLFKGVFQGNDGLRRFVRNLFGIQEETGLDGGGPIEAVIRLFRQLNLTSDLEMGLAERIIKYIDLFGMLVLRLTLQLFPDFSRFDNSNYVAYGFNVDPNVMAVQTMTALAFVAGTSLLGYFFLKTRELAA